MNKDNNNTKAVKTQTVMRILSNIAKVKILVAGRLRMMWMMLCGVSVQNIDKIIILTNIRATVIEIFEVIFYV